MIRMSALLASRKCKTTDTERDSFQSISADVTSFLGNNADDTETKLAMIMKYNFKAALEIKR